MATVLVEEQAPNAGKVQSILNMRELQEQTGSQLLALPYRMFLLHARKEMKSGKILPLDIWRWLGLLLNRRLPYATGGYYHAQFPYKFHNFS
jgi:hypothetical protein